MDKNVQELHQLAVKNLANSFSPYSNFPVSAVLQTKSGKVYTGVNIENASYGLSMCAERVCLFNYVNDGAINDPIETFLVTGKTNNPISPCGACRQVMVEFIDKTTNIVLTNVDGQSKDFTLEQLLPYYFEQGDLTDGQ